MKRNNNEISFTLRLQKAIVEVPLVIIVTYSDDSNFNETNSIFDIDMNSDKNSINDNDNSDDNNYVDDSDNINADEFNLEKERDNLVFHESKSKNTDEVVLNLLEL